MQPKNIIKKPNLQKNMEKNMRHLFYYINVLRSYWRRFLYLPKSKKRTFIRKENILNSPLYDDVCRWQKKQIKSMTYNKIKPQRTKSTFFNKTIMQKIHRKTLLEVQHKNEGMWEVSTDTLQRGRGISLDQAIVTMHRLRDAGFPDSMLGVVSIARHNRRHSFAIVQDKEDDFWILDNGYFLNTPCRASSYLGKRKDIQYLIGFNFFDVWNY